MLKSVMGFEYIYIKLGYDTLTSNYALYCDNIALECHKKTLWYNNMVL